MHKLWEHRRNSRGRAVKALLLALLLALPAGAAAPWTPGDTVLELAAEAGLASEWAQMVNNPTGGQITGLDADLFGHHPSRATLNRYFAAWMITHPLISWQLPQPWRLGFQSATIGFELIVTRDNAAIGCRIHF